MDGPQKLSGIDFGAWTTKVAAFKDNRHFQVLLNQANFRETPSVVGFSDSERKIGEQGVIKMKSNFKNTLRSPLRLLGLERKEHMIQQQLKFCTVDHALEKTGLKFYPQISGERVEMDPQQFLVALMTKAKSIIEANSIFPEFYFISIPSYLDNGERKAVKMCAEAAGYRNISLVEQWQAICAEYIFFRQKQLQSQTDSRLVIFIDVGYAKFSAHACLVSSKEALLLDSQYLRYTGARNMDRQLIEFYSSMIKGKFGAQVQKNPKGLVKLFQNVESQRKKLSANQENHLNIECIIGDNDIDYNMKREEFQNIAMPVFGEFASSLQNLKNRVEPYAKLHSIQLIGGTSRTPFFQELTKNIFNCQPSKTLNTSETVARGASIAGANRLGLLGPRTINFIRSISKPIYCFIHSISKQNPYGRQLSLYKENMKKPIFANGEQIPANHIVKIPIGGPVQLLIFQEVNMGKKVLGYFQFLGQDNLACLIDMDGILRVRLSNKESFLIYDVGDYLSIEQGAKLKQQEESMKVRDQNFLTSYEIRNQFQGLLYKIKDSLKGELQQFISPNEEQNLKETIHQNEEWVSHIKNPQVNQFKERMQALNIVCDVFYARKKNFDNSSPFLKKFRQKYSLLSKIYKGKPEKLMSLDAIKEKVDELQAQECSVMWEGTYLNEKVLQQILQQVQNVKK